MSARKRPVEVLDLTGDDTPLPRSSFSSSRPFSQATSQAYHSHSSPQPPRAPKKPRPSYSPLNRHGLATAGSQLNPYTIDDDDDDAGTEEVQDASQSFNEAQYRFDLYGVLHTKVVGCRFYDGVATIGEMVILRREPHNQYDRNAIQVQNVQGVQIGHIPRAEAAKLAPYMDNYYILPEGIITGPKAYYECPIELRLYGTNEPVQRADLIARMKDDRLPVGHAVDRVRKEERAAKQAAEQARERARERARVAAYAASMANARGANVAPPRPTGRGENPMGTYTGGSSQAQTFAPPPSLEDIVDGSQRINPRSVEEVVEQFGVKEEDLKNMGAATQPEGILTQLRPFQLQGLKWMLDKESPQLPARGAKKVVQLWQRHPTMPDTFTNMATNFSTKNPTLASGGILADDMGLGKTIQMISLILADRSLNKKAAEVSGATLILAPVSVMSNWATQMKKHIKEEFALRVMIFHGSRKETISPETIKNYDVVISSYGTVSYEWQKKDIKSGPFSVTWRRIVLDEAHIIRSPKAKLSVAVTSLQSQSRWALTGTPIINNLKDLYSIVRFLRLSGGLDTFSVFNGSIIRPVLQGDARANTVLQLLMRDMCLRRKKEHKFIDLRLPELSEYVHRLDLLPHEKEKYDALEAQAKGTLDLYRSKIGAGKGRDAFSTYHHVLEILLRMRQVCDHWKLVGEQRLSDVLNQLAAEGVVDLTEENITALQAMLKVAIESQEECPICIDTLRDPVITKCAHIFCTTCIERTIDMQHKCPMCRAELDSLPSTTVKPAKENVTASQPTKQEILDADSLARNSSTKVDAILQILSASKKDPSTKTIIFSQWTSFLDLLSPHLLAAGHTFTRIDGSMTALKRDEAITALDTCPNTTIMLASLAVCSVGLNLVAANQVILADSWWAPAIEDQAVDRVHRLGQLRETRVFRLVVRGSVEERVLAIQEDKRRLMGLAFAEREVRRGRRRDGGGGLADLERLLGRGTQGASGSASASAGRETVVQG